MKTTLDLPPELIREMKLRAAGEGRKLRDVATEIFRRGLACADASPREVYQRRVKLPLIACEQRSERLTAAKVAAILLKQEVEWIDEAAGR
jgi:plasmid stability protein